MQSAGAGPGEAFLEGSPVLYVHPWGSSNEDAGLPSVAGAGVCISPCCQCRWCTDHTYSTPAPGLGPQGGLSQGGKGKQAWRRFREVRCEHRAWEHRDPVSPHPEAARVPF